MERPDPVHDAHHEAGAVIARGRTALASEHQKAGGVRGVVLDVPFQHREDLYFSAARRPATAPVCFSFAASSAERAFEEVSMISTRGRLFWIQPRHCASDWGWAEEFFDLQTGASC